MFFCFFSQPKFWLWKRAGRAEPLHMEVAPSLLSCASPASPWASQALLDPKTLPAPPVPLHLTEAFISPASSADLSLSPSLSLFQDPV